MRDLLLGVQPSLTLLILVVVTATAIIDISVLLNTRRILRLSERRMQFLAEEQQRLELRRNEYALLEKTLEQEREVRLAAQQKVKLLTNQAATAKRAKRKASGTTS